jgi:hypothetical protein
MIHPIMSSRIAESQIIMTKAYPLVREIVHKYKLHVIGIKQSNWSVDDENNCFYIANNEGMVLGIAGFNRDGQYTFRTVITPKERGRTTEDRMTYAAAKVSVLMRNIEKYHLLPNDSLEVFVKLNHFYDLVNIVLAKQKNVGKHNPLNGESLHRLLKVAFGYQPLENLSLESMEKFKKILDDYDKVDKTREEKLNIVKEVFDKPVKFLMYDSTDTFLKGEINIGIKLDEDYRVDDARPVAVKCERVDRFMDDPDFASRLAMYKVLGQKDDPDMRFVGEEQFFPLGRDSYNEELGLYRVDTDGWRHDFFPAKPRWLFLV